MRIALVEPYHGGSHAAWADGYAASSRHDVEVIAHPARFWKWRMQGSFLTLAEELEASIADRGPPDLILASSMMDVAAFAGAIRHAAPAVPIVTYFHESQFTYPLSPMDRVDATYAMKNWASAAVSDLVVFNSGYHRDVFAEGAAALLRAFPEYTHTHRLDGVMERSIVLPVGIDLEPMSRARPVAADPPLVVWNHRWEHDKGPEGLAAVVAALDARGVDYRMALCGEIFVSVPEAFNEVLSRLGERAVQRGWADRDRYERLLLESSVVLSTAHQEFFGIGVVEAIAAGAHPVLPDRLVYRERVAALGLDPARVLYGTEEEAATLIVDALSRPSDEAARRAVMQYDWSVVAPLYDEALARA